MRKLFDVHVDGKDVVLGNVAFLRCRIPDGVREFVHVVSWYRGDEILLPEQADIGEYKRSEIAPKVSEGSLENCCVF